MVGDIIAEWWATSSRIRGRLPPESARTPHVVWAARRGSAESVLNGVGFAWSASLFGRPAIRDLRINPAVG